MQVVGAFRACNSNMYDVKSTSLNGWEYLIVWEDVGSSLMFAIYALFNL